VLLAMILMVVVPIVVAVVVGMMRMVVVNGSRDMCIRCQQKQRLASVDY
jgi:hypothetical protein